jgi:hypothetical protein
MRKITAKFPKNAVTKKYLYSPCKVFSNQIYSIFMKSKNSNLALQTVIY